jgi:2'-5' RNA ligase superfamily
MCAPAHYPPLSPLPPTPEKAERWFSAPDFRSTIAVVPPADSECWARLQGIRRECRAVGLYRWPPHCNIVYPFVPPRIVNCGGKVPELLDIASAISGLPPFEVRLRHLEIFMHERSVTLILCPETRVLSGGDDGDGHNGEEGDWTYFRSGQNLCSRIHNAAQRGNPDVTASLQRVFVPHISIARFSSELVAQMWKARIEGELRRRPMTFAVLSVHILVRRGAKPFQGMWEIPLRGKSSESAEERVDALRPSSLDAYSHPALSEMFPNEYDANPQRQSRKRPVQVHGRPLSALRRRLRPWYS